MWSRLSDTPEPDIPSRPAWSAGLWRTETVHSPEEPAFFLSHPPLNLSSSCTDSISTYVVYVVHVQYTEIRKKEIQEKKLQLVWNIYIYISWN